jgi:hypothetical protein
MKNFLAILLCLSAASAFAADFDIEQFKAQAVTSRVMEDSSQLLTNDDPSVALGPVVITRSEPKVFPPAPATYVKIYPLAGKDFGENLISRVSVRDKSVVPQLLELTPRYAIYAFTRSGDHEVRFIQIGQNPLDFAEREVTVSVGNGPNPPPVDPGDPNPPPVSGSVAEASRKGAAALNDPATASAMATALLGAVSQAEGKSIDEQKLIVRTAIETVLLDRKGESRSKDWLALWREPVNTAIAAENPQVNYLALIRQAAAGLGGSSASRSLPTVTMFSLTACQNCDLFKRVDLPLIKYATVRIDSTGANPSVIRYPSFLIEAYGKRMMAEGYHTADQIRELIGYMAVQ